MRIVLATANRDKVAELGEMFPGVDVGGAPDGFDVEETGVTLLQNAWIKAAALRGEIADDAWVALRLALGGLLDGGGLDRLPLTDSIAAVSVGMVEGRPLLDLAYVEDSRAESDMNVVMTGSGRLVEVQATAEGSTFSRGELDVLLDLAEGGVRDLTAAQTTAISATAVGA